MIRGAHDGAISTVEWVPGQPVLISSGDDNSVKVKYTIGRLVIIASLKTSSQT